MRVRVDATKCLGNGFCEATAEDVFEVGQDSVVHLLVDAVPERRRAEMEKAVEDCPVSALSIED